MPQATRKEFPPINVTLTKELKPAVKDAEGNITQAGQFEERVFELNIPQFELDGKIYAAEEVESESDLLKQLVEMRVGFLKELV